MNIKITIKERCRELRKNQTNAEAILWKYVRNRNLGGLKIVRQFPIVYQVSNINETKFFIVTKKNL